MTLFHHLGTAGRGQVNIYVYLQEKFNKDQLTRT
jgi:hypothetical protein